jgi:hypothetical protein
MHYNDHEKQPLSYLNDFELTLPFCFSLASIPTSSCPHQEKYPHIPYIFHAWQDVLYSQENVVPLMLLEDLKSNERPTDFIWDIT